MREIVKHQPGEVGSCQPRSGEVIDYHPGGPTPILEQPRGHWTLGQPSAQILRVARDLQAHWREYGSNLPIQQALHTANAMVEDRIPGIRELMARPTTPGEQLAAHGFGTVFGDMFESFEHGVDDMYRQMDLLGKPVEPQSEPGSQIYRKWEVVEEQQPSPQTTNDGWRVVMEVQPQIESPDEIICLPAPTEEYLIEESLSFRSPRLTASVSEVDQRLISAKVRLSTTDAGRQRLEKLEKERIERLGILRP